MKRTLCLLPALLLAACGSEDADPRVPMVVDFGTPAEQPERTLVWSDEFDAPAGTPVDPTKWTHDIGGNGWGNEQLEFNTDRVENVSHDGDGHLVITARRERFEGNEYTSARIKTEGLFSVRYGRIEARIKQPIGQGLWPAFWMLGANFATVGWPECGEIDIMEYKGQLPEESTAAIHGPGYSAGQSIWGVQRGAGNLNDDFHVYAIDWTADRIVFYVDDLPFFQVSSDSIPAGTRWAYQQEFFLILNLAVGGTFLGNPDASTQFPQTLMVDWVRVYE